MSPKELTAFRLDSSLLKSLRAVSVRDGLGVSEAVRQAVVEWLDKRHAELGALHRAFDTLESAMTAVSNRSGALDELLLPKEFGSRLGGRPLGSLTENDMETFDMFAQTIGRKEKGHRLFWQKATEQSRERARRRDMELPTMPDNEARRELFRLLVARLREERRKDSSLVVIERTPMLMVERRGHGAEIDQGHGSRLMRGTMTWRRDEDADGPFQFSVVRSVDKKRLQMRPGPEGHFDDIVDDIVTTFLQHAQ